MKTPWILPDPERKNGFSFGIPKDGGNNSKEKHPLHKARGTFLKGKMKLPHSFPSGDV